MYTGIIHHVGTIRAIQTFDNGLRLTIACQFNKLQLGESIALNGICVTVAAHKGKQFDCALSPETLKLTAASTSKIGDNVNLERSLTLQDRLGGHFVLGHVDATATVSLIEQQADFTRILFTGLLATDRPYVTKKGSICVNGVSLTINEVYVDGFAVMLIPHTQHHTNLKYLQKNSLVNIEFDTLAKIVARQLQLLTKA